METVGTYIKPAWVWVFAIMVFFFNSLLPQGLTYTLLLTPAWIFMLYKQQKLKMAIWLLLPFFLYAIVHFYYGVFFMPYLISAIVLCSMVLFLVVFYDCLKSRDINWDLIFRDIVILNFLFCMLSLALLFIAPLKPLVWYLIPISPNIPIIPRLKLFTEEASHYSLLLALPFIYFVSRLFFFKTTHALPVLIMLGVPLMLSFSLGVLSCLFFTGLFIVFLYFRRIFNSRKRIVLFLCCTVALPLLFWWAYYAYPNNALFVRVMNIFHGDDTSARGRTYESFILADKIAALKSYWWGIGEGQLKIIGRSIVIQFYSYFNVPEVIRIPNACAETIACFGYIGFAVRIMVLVTLFFTTKVYTNPFRLWLYIFMFVYQFTGSYLTNVTEYIIWLLAFSPVFPEFIKKQSKPLL